MSEGAGEAREQMHLRPRTASERGTEGAALVGAGWCMKAAWAKDRVGHGEGIVRWPYVGMYESCKLLEAHLGDAE